MKIIKKRARPLLFFLLCAVTIGVSVYAASQGKDTWTESKYGTTSDGTINITSGQEIKAAFTIEDDSFQGIFIKLSAETKYFENEKLHFYLVDQHTQKMISQYTMELCKTLSQFNVFVPLPCEDAEGREVFLYITGEDIYYQPVLVTSQLSASESTLYIDEVEQKKSALVFSGAYLSHQDFDYAPLIKGAIYLLLLALIFCWNNGKNAGKAHGLTDKKPGGVDPAVGAKYSVHTITWQKKVIGLLITSMVFAVAALFIYKQDIQELIAKNETKTLVKVDEEANQIVLNSENKLLYQRFKVEESDLSTVSYTVKAKAVSASAKIRVTIEDHLSGNCYLQKEFALSTFSSAKGTWDLIFSRRTAAADRTIDVTIEPLNFNGDELIIYTGAVETDNEIAVFLDEVRTAVYPALTVKFNDNDYLKRMYWGYALMLYLAMVVIYLLLVWSGLSLRKVFIPVSLLLGVLYLLVIPIYSVPDEYTHIDTAYSLCNRIMGIEKPEELCSYDYKRACDIETEELLTYYTSTSDYRRLYNELFSMADDEELTLCTVTTAMNNANVLFYLPAALGLLAARVLGLGTLPMLLLGRLFNLVTFVILCYLALRKLPALQYVFMFTATLPIVLQQAASYSYDAILNAIAFVFIAYCLHIAMTRETIDQMDMAVVLFTMVQLASVKGGTYLPLCFLILIIPIERCWKSRRRIGYVMLCLCMAGMAFIQSNIVRIISRFFNSSTTRVNSFTGVQMYTLSYLLHHPVKWVKLFIETFFTEGSRLFYELFGGKMGSLSNIQMPWMYVIAFVLLLVCLMQQEEISCRIKNSWSKLGVWLLAIGTVLLLEFSMLLADTRLTQSHITGVQGRYFIPVAFLPIMLITPGLADNYSGKKHPSILMYAYYVVQMVFILNIIKIVL